MSLLKVEGLAKAFGGVKALDGVSFSVEPGELLAMIGPNGAGKTTCFNIVNGQLPGDRGMVHFEGLSVGGLAPHRLFRLGIGRTFQITATFSSMTVRENVQLALLSARQRLARFWAAASDQFADEADALLQAVGVGPQAERACAELSYGDLKRVELAVALGGSPRLLLMDEPTAGMASRERGDLMALVARLALERRIGVLFTEHDMDIVFGHAHRVLVLSAGRVIAQGTPAQVRDDPEVRRVYLGVSR